MFKSKYFPLNKPYPSHVKILNSSGVTFGVSNKNFDFYGDTHQHYALISKLKDAKVRITDKNLDIQTKYIDLITNIDFPICLKFPNNLLDFKIGFGDKGCRLLVDHKYENLSTSYDIILGPERSYSTLTTQQNPFISLGLFYSEKMKSLYFCHKAETLKFQLYLTMGSLTSIRSPTYVALKLYTKAGNASVGLASNELQNTLYSFWRFSKKLEPMKLFYSFFADQGFSYGISRTFLDKTLKTKFFYHQRSVCSAFEYCYQNKAIILSSINYSIPEKMPKATIGVKLLLD